MSADCVKNDWIVDNIMKCNGACGNGDINVTKASHESQPQHENDDLVLRNYSTNYHKLN